MIILWLMLACSFGFACGWALRTYCYRREWSEMCDGARKAMETEDQ